MSKIRSFLSKFFFFKKGSEPNYIGRFLLLFILFFSYIYVHFIKLFSLALRYFGLSRAWYRLVGYYDHSHINSFILKLRTLWVNFSYRFHTRQVAAAERYYFLHSGPKLSPELEDQWSHRQFRSTRSDQYSTEMLESFLVALARQGWRSRERWWQRRVAQTLPFRCLTSAILAAQLTYLLLPVEQSFTAFLWPLFLATLFFHFKAFSVAIMAKHDLKAVRPLEITVGVLALGGVEQLPSAIHQLRSRLVSPTRNSPIVNEVTIGEATGYDLWLTGLNLSPASQEIYYSLVSEYAGSVGELARASIALNDC